MQHEIPRSPFPVHQFFIFSGLSRSTLAPGHRSLFLGCRVITVWLDFPSEAMSSSPPSNNPVAAPPEEKGDAATLTEVDARYRLVRKLGRGGMGTVFLVLDKDREDRPLALKRLRGGRVDKKTIAILRKEFLALATLEHPGLARVYDFGVDCSTGDYFFIGEFVDGVNLLKACQGFDLEKKEGLETFAGIFAQILRALEFIHSRGLVHGDIKPENILVTGASPGAPCVKLIDFGLIKREKEFGGKKITGTTYYIAPETITGSQIDRRTDLYSLGVVLYHLATGRLPFSGDSNVAILKGHMEKAPEPPAAVKPGLPE